MWSLPMSSTKPANKINVHPLRLSGKTSRACLATAPTPLAACWAHWPAKAVHSNRQGQNGRTQVTCLAPNAVSPGVCSTLNISGSPNVANACFLWQVVETTSIPPKYFLSAKACTGILRRITRRGKTLPALLEHALHHQVTMLD